MIYIKATIYSLLAVLVAVLGYGYFTFDSNYQVDIAREHLEKGQYEEALIALDKIEESGQVPILALYRNHIYRAQGKLLEAYQVLLQNEEAIKSSASRSDLLEFYLNQAVNLYELQRFSEFSKVLSRARELSPTDSKVSMLSGLESFLEEDFQKALEIWSIDHKFEEGSDWLNSTFATLFSPISKTLYAAKAQIETGEHLAARERLENLEGPLNDREKTEALLLIGLSHLKEAEENQLPLSLTHYQLAQSYFSRVPLLEVRYDKERQEIVRVLLRTGKQLIEERDTEGLLFVQKALNSLQANSQLDLLSHELINHLSQAIDQSDWSYTEQLTALLNRFLDSPDLRQLVSQQFARLMQEAINTGSFEHLSQYWETARLFSPSPEVLTRKIASNALEKTLRVLATDNHKLSETAAYLAFWNAVEKDAQERLIAAQRIVKLAGTTATKEGALQKSANMLKIAIGIPYLGEQKTITENIEEELRIIHNAVSKEDDIEKIALIYETIRFFGFTEFRKNEKNTIANHLADAEYLLSNGKYESALKQVRLALKLNPKNHPALELAGLIAHQQGDYKGAVEFLTQVQNLTSKAKEALAVSYLVLGQREEGLKLLGQLEQGHALSTLSTQHLGFLAMIQNNPHRALRYFARIRRPDGEVLAASCFAAFQTKNWEAALRYYKHLPLAYQNVPALQAIAIQSLAIVGQVNTAEQILKQLLAQEEANSAALEYTPLFRTLSNKHLQTENPHLIAALFYKEYRKNYVKALEHFDQIPVLSPTAHLAHGEILLSMERFEEAEKALKPAVIQDNDLIIRQRAMPILADLYHKLGRNSEALIWYRNYFATEPETFEPRDQFAKALVEFRLWNEAAEQYRLIMKEKPLALDQKVAYIECLLRSGRTDIASKMARTIMLENRSIPLFIKLRLAKLMLMTDETDLITGVLHLVPDTKALSLASKEALLELYIQMGEYEEAERLVFTIREHLGQSSEGLMLLARLSLNLSRTDRAISLAKEASIFSPNDYDIQAFILHNEHNRAYTLQLKEKQEAELKLYPDSLSLQMAYARTLIDLAEEDQHIDEMSLDAYAKNLAQATAVLEPLSHQFSEFPEIHFLLGKAYTLSGNNQAALAAFQLSTELDPSNHDAYLYLGAISGQQGDYTKGIAYLEQAIQVAPYCAESLWEIAALYRLNEETLDAKISMKKYLHYRPQDQNAYFTLANDYLSLQNVEDAIGILETLIEINPNHIEALQLLTRCLHNEILEITGYRKGSLAQYRQNIYEKLYALDSRLAERLIAELPSTDVHSPISESTNEI